MNYKLKYRYDGYPFWDIVAAETAEDARELLAYKHPDFQIFEVEEASDEYTPTYIATAEELTEARTPLWKKRGAESEEEWIAYQAYCQPLREEAMIKDMELLEKAEEEAEKTGDWTHYDELYNGKSSFTAPSIEEWRERRKQ